MQSLVSFFLDLIFPPSREAQKLRSLSIEEMWCTFQKPEAPPHTFITSLFSYKDPLVKELVLSIKNKKDRYAISCAAGMLHKKLLESSVDKVVLLPIPVSKKHRRERGYNQCELIVDEMCKLSDRYIKSLDILTRTKDGGEQKLKNREKRLMTKNIFSARVAHPEEAIVHIVIIDDVVTTGSTLLEARETLLRAGYIQVSALTIAH